jgi:hypothetical protein
MYLNELSKNVDGYRLSTFFHKDRDDNGGKLKMGPHWDYDLAWNNADYCENAITSGWAYNFNYVCVPNGSFGYVPFWWERLMEDDVFKQNAACRWQNLRMTTLSKDSIYAKIDSMKSVVLEAQARNFNLWPILGIYVWPNPAPIPANYNGEIAKLKLWVKNRLNWLDTAFGQTSSEPQSDFSEVVLGGMQWQFQATNTSLGATFLWNFGDGTTSTLASPQHTFGAIGNFNIRLTVTSPYGCSSETVKNFSVSSLFDLKNTANSLLINPNPAKDIAFISLAENLSSDCNLLLINALGEIILQKNVAFKDGETQLMLSEVPSGIYTLQVRSNQKTWVGVLNKM